MQLIKLLQELIKCKSITPDNDGALELLVNKLTNLGFKCELLEFTGDNSYAVKNLYARYGTAAPNFCFAGHTDVVPVGDASAWQHNPFGAEIEDGKIYGRGIVDMKGSIAAMVIACNKFISHHQFKGSISFLITGDEEAQAINGTQKVLEKITKEGEILDACLIGEPSCSNFIGDTIKIGRRGSISFYLTINGIQGHIAYPHLTDNPITHLINILHELKLNQLDPGNLNFELSNLEITNIEVNNKAENVIPAHASAHFNIRFNDEHTSKSLVKLITSVCDKYAKGKYKLEYRISGEAFIVRTSNLPTQLVESIYAVVGKKPVYSTGGGTSDARFIKDYCPVVEFGLINATAHKVDEHSSIKNIEILSEIYYDLLKKYFNIE